MHDSFLLENLVHSGIYDAFQNVSFHPIYLASKIASIIFGAVISVYAYRMYKTVQSNVLLGITLSFGFMSFTDVFMVLILPTINNLNLFNLYFWLRLVTMSFAFGFLALAYFTSTRVGIKSIPLKMGMLSTIPISSIILATWFFNNSSLPPVTDYSEYFRIFNIAALAYVIIISYKSIIFNPRKGLSYIPFVYGIFLVGQVSLLLFSLQGSLSSVITAFLVKDIGLGIFAKIIYDSNSNRKHNLKGLKLPY
ncbi:MAG: hypothetical protein WAN80_09220, partial [Nitrosotalea sp.]